MSLVNWFKDIMGAKGIRLFLGSGTRTGDHGSNAGIQYTSEVANRAQIRVNQYGPNSGVAGITAFKSRGPIDGPDVSLINGDLLWRATAIGITPTLLIPLSGFVSYQVPNPLTGTARVPATPGGSVPGNPWLGSEFEVRTTSVYGPVNGHRPVLICDSLGVTNALRGIRVGGPSTAATPAAMAEGALWSSGSGDPNGAVMGNVGDMWSRIDGGLGSTLYVKEAGNQNNVGWTAK